MRSATVILLIFFFCNLSAQHKFNGRIEGYLYRDLNICTQFGDDSKLIATIKTDFTGAFDFSMENREIGLYRVYLESEDYFDIIYNNEDIEVITRTSNPQFNMTVLKSDENKQYYEYIIKNFELEYKIEILSQLIDIYPEGDFSKKASTELNKEIKKRNKNIDNSIKINPSSFAGRYISFFRQITPPTKLNEAEKLEFIKNNYWDEYKMSDVDLLNSDAYNYVILNYFKLIRRPTEELYLNAARTIMDKVSLEDALISEFALEYILSGFEIMEMNEIASIISYEYLDICKNENNLSLRIKNNTELNIGRKAPDFYVNTLSGQEYSLSGMKSKYTLLVFWATWCNHCTEMLPLLAENIGLFNKYGIDIIAVSLDTDTQLLNDYISYNAIPFKIIVDFEGWNGTIPKDYAIYATPAMYLIDKDMSIVAKPNNETILLNVIENLNTDLK